MTMEFTAILTLLLITALTGGSVWFYWRARQLASLLAENDAVSNGLEAIAPA